MRVVASLCVVLLVFVAACAPNGETTVTDSAATVAAPAVDVAAVRQVIADTNRKFADALTRGDTAVVAPPLSDDAVLIESSYPAWRGRSEILTNIAKFLQTAVFQHQHAAAVRIGNRESGIGLIRRRLPRRPNADWTDCAETLGSDG